jgi:hypothetical protein
MLDGQCGTHWEVVETDGWLGFKNPVSDTYIAHDGSGKFVANVKHHKSYEFFCPRQHPGSHLLMSLLRIALWRTEVGPDGISLVARKDKGAVWVFEKV